MRQTLRFNSREEWLQARSEGIGASEVASILGVSPFESAYQLWLRKKGVTPPKEENFAMKAGHYLEDAVASFYKDETGCTIIKSSAVDFMYADKERPFLRVSPDRTFWKAGDAHNEANKCILECKTTQRTIDPDDIPNHWFVQVQMNLGVAGFKTGALAWLTAARTFGQIEIPFQEDFYGMLVDEVSRFWYDYIVGDKEPEATTVGDVVAKYIRSTEGKIVDATPEVFEAYKDLKEVSRQIAELEEKEKSLSNALKVALQDAEVLKYDGRTIATWKSAKNSLKFDAKRFQAEHAELCEPYMVDTVGSRRFQVK